MKGLFPQFDGRSSINYQDAWKGALFVFDTNVLLNLYRYQISTREDLLKVLQGLASRVWIPHHVALEFQRNRLGVIAEQERRFIDVKNALTKSKSQLASEIDKLQLKTRHSLINPEPILLGFDKLVADFLAELERLRGDQQKLTEPDPIKGYLEELFDGRVGDAPTKQGEVDELYRDAERRYQKKVPPGYLDISKDKDDTDEYLHGGIYYKRKYGDYIVWKQILAHAKRAGVASLIFVTDDAKEDWWQKLEVDGPKTIGPRPELIEEAQNAAGITTLLMYSPEAFLKFATSFLKAEISVDTLKEVREVSTAYSSGAAYEDARSIALSAERAVGRWLRSRYEIVNEHKVGFPDFVAINGGDKYGFEVKVAQNPRSIVRRIKDMIYRAYLHLQDHDYKELTIIFVTKDFFGADIVMRGISSLIDEVIHDDLRFMVGILDGFSDDGYFVPYLDYSAEDMRMMIRDFK